MAGSHSSIHYRKKALPLGLVRAIRKLQTRRIYERFSTWFPPRPEARVLDLGVSAAEGDRDLHFFECAYPYLDRVVAAGVEPPGEFARLFPSVRYVEVQRKAPLPFEDAEFDVVFSSAVVEHVGTRADQRAFLQEVLRVGQRAFVTTPNRWYPIEFHTMLPLIHYLPTATYRPLLERLGFAFFADEQNLNLLDMETLAELVCTDRKVRLETLDFLGWPANLLLMVGPRSGGPEAA
jgi:hypothetical protein